MATQYEQIAQALRERITSGDYAPGTALPYMRDIAEEFSVSNITVRKAYGLLTREGLIESRRRTGVFVRELPDRLRLVVRARQIERDELGYFSGPEVQHWRAIPHPDGEKTRVTTAPAPADVADVLGVETGELLTVRKRIVGDPDVENHRQLADSWIPAWVTEEVPALSGDTGMGGMYDRVEEWAGRPLSWREEVSARMPSPEESSALLMPETGVPLLRALRVTFLPARRRQPERIVEVQDVRMSAELFAVGYPLPRGESAKWPVRPATSDYYQADPDELDGTE
ncbi:GntR family transcriptional regulator [Streptomyces sp. PH10-H1]|uniref:GntR family transcriptional regulator n=1 Tax=Streptomyces sp. PH10-H1 TaxID=3046212 RepID=UPI0024B8C2BF|nr:GntR family transcriptional regulator [Streptomyces sp. PH10-H1]MDJ0347502.1 GntR family transcriptional regulator [Streptomyces sp. PH10-H1]